MEMFFPFDPYLLKRSSRHLRLKDNYVRWRHGHPQVRCGVFGGVGWWCNRCTAPKLIGWLRICAKLSLLLKALAAAGTLVGGCAGVAKWEMCAAQ